jgi:hypothetical protein
MARLSVHQPESVKVEVLMKISPRLASTAAIAALSVTLAAQQGGHIGPSGAAVAGAAVGVGAVVTLGVVLAVNHSHHVMSGCVVSGADGLKLQTSDSKTYDLEGATGDLKAGNRVKIHGSKIKKTRGVTGPDVFKVEKLNKDYGACHVERASLQGATLHSFLARSRAPVANTAGMCR